MENNSDSFCITRLASLASLFYKTNNIVNNID